MRLGVYNMTACFLLTQVKMKLNTELLFHLWKSALLFFFDAWLGRGPRISTISQH